MLIDLHLDGLIEFETLEAHWRNWWPAHALDVFGEALGEDTRLRLEDDVAAPNGRRWAAWSPAYAATRGPEHKLLFDTGDLSRSLESKRSGAVLEFGSPLPYALTHQHGSRSRNIPARPYVGISRELSSALDSIFVTDFEGGWRGLGHA